MGGIRPPSSSLSRLPNLRLKLAGLSLFGAPQLRRIPLGRSPLSGAVLASLERKEEPYG
jgi:hypothetical protein